MFIENQFNRQYRKNSEKTNNNLCRIKLNIIFMYFYFTQSSIDFSR